MFEQGAPHNENHAGRPVVVASVGKNGGVFIERRLNSHARRILDDDLNRLGHDLRRTAVLRREHDSGQAVGIELDVAVGVETEGETGVGEQSRAAGLPGFLDRARRGPPVGLVPLGAVVHTKTGTVGVGESIGIPPLEANHSGEGLTHVRQSLIAY